MQRGTCELLEDGSQYGTTIQSPFLEAALAFDTAVEYIETGKLNETIRFTPNPISTGETWDGQVVEFLDKVRRRFIVYLESISRTNECVIGYRGSTRRL